MDFNRLDSGYVYICNDIHEENTFQSNVCGYVEPNKEEDSLFIVIKRSAKSDSLLQTWCSWGCSYHFCKGNRTVADLRYGE